MSSASSMKDAWRLEITEEIQSLRRDTQWSDVIFVCSDASLSSHKVCLAQTSSFLHNLLLASGDEPTSVIVPDITGDQMDCYLDAVYSGKLPSSQQELSAVTQVHSMLNPDNEHKSDFKKHEEIFDINKENLILKKEVLPSKPNAIYMTTEERQLKSKENLETLCRFCLQTVGNHKVSIKVKQEWNNSYHLKNQYVCCLCGTVTGTPSNFIGHQKYEAAKYIGVSSWSLWQFDCNHCGKTIEQHLNSNQGFICCHCQEEFGSPGVLTIHLKTLDIEKNLKNVECDYCNSFLPKSMIKRHMNKCRFQNQLLKKGFTPCEDCDKFKKSKKEKMAHLKSRHPEHHQKILKRNADSWKDCPSSRYVNCDICNKSIRKCNLKDHKLYVHRLNMANEVVELKSSENVCDICGHVSKHAKDVKKHKKFVHEKVLNFECKFCGKKFSNKGNLNQHEVIHTGVTPYQCHLCGKQCRRRSELEKHIETHPAGASTTVPMLNQETENNQFPVCVPASVFPSSGGSHQISLSHNNVGNGYTLDETIRQADLMKEMKMPPFISANDNKFIIQ